MNLEIVRADSGADAVIWLVLGVFWLIAQAISKLRGGSRPPPRPPPIESDERSIEEDLRTLFEQISGQQQPPQPPPPPPITKAMKPVPYGAGKRHQRPPNVKQKSAGRFPPAQQAVPELPHAVAEAPQEFHEIHALPKARSRGGMFKESTFGFNAITTPLPALLPLGVNAEGRGAQLRELVKGRRQFKRAMISQIVLGPPRALST